MEAFFQASAHVIFVNVTLANASHRAILESVWEGTTKGMERGGGDFVVVLKYLPHSPVPEFRLLEGDTSDLLHPV